MLNLVDLTDEEKHISNLCNGRESSVSPLKVNANTKRKAIVIDLLESQESVEFALPDGIEAAESSSSSDPIRRLSWKEELQNGTDEDRATLALLLEEELKRDSELANKVYTCAVCLDPEVKLEDMVSLCCVPKAHKFCSDCFVGFCTSKIAEGQVKSKDLKCPIPDCDTVITVHEMKAHLPENVFAKYERFMLKDFAEENSEMFKWCPACNEWFCEVDMNEDPSVWSRIACGGVNCNHEYCGGCGQKPHKGHNNLNLTCAKFAALLEREKTLSEDDVGFQDYIRNSKEFQTCPSCGNAATLQKGGCKFAYCKCRKKFCFLCGVELFDSDHYGHFKGPGLAGPFGEKCLGPNDPLIGLSRGGTSLTPLPMRVPVRRDERRARPPMRPTPVRRDERRARPPMRPAPVRRDQRRARPPMRPARDAPVQVREKKRRRRR